jgi:hypothetical protein
VNWADPGVDLSMTTEQSFNENMAKVVMTGCGSGVAMAMSQPVSKVLRAQIDEEILLDYED